MFDLRNKQVFCLLNLVCLYKTEDASLLRNLSFTRKLRIRKVL